MLTIAVTKYNSWWRF